jgi:hypothetical protein
VLGGRLLPKRACPHATTSSARTSTRRWRTRSGATGTTNTRAAHPSAGPRPSYRPSRRPAASTTGNPGEPRRRPATARGLLAACALPARRRALHIAGDAAQTGLSSATTASALADRTLHPGLPERRRPFAQTLCPSSPGSRTPAPAPPPPSARCPRVHRIATEWPRPISCARHGTPEAAHARHACRVAASPAMHSSLLRQNHVHCMQPTHVPSPRCKHARTLCNGEGATLQTDHCDHPVLARCTCPERGRPRCHRYQPAFPSASTSAPLRSGAGAPSPDEPLRNHLYMHFTLLRARPFAASTLGALLRLCTPAEPAPLRTSRNWTQPSPDIYNRNTGTLSRPALQTHTLLLGPRRIFQVVDSPMRVLGSSNNTTHLPTCGIGAFYSPFSNTSHGHNLRASSGAFATPSSTSYPGLICTSVPKHTNNEDPLFLASMQSLFFTTASLLPTMVALLSSRTSSSCPSTVALCAPIPPSPDLISMHSFTLDGIRQLQDRLL